MSKPILCLDFDGVCHSYVSGWQGADAIPDPPVEGLFEFLYEAVTYFEIHIFSSRTHQDGGREAMELWFREWWSEWVVLTFFAGYNIVNYLHFPTHKPAAKVTIDDRGILFMGVWPNVELLRNFQPWNKGEG